MLPFEKAPTDRSVGNVAPYPEAAKEAVSRETPLISLAWTVAGAIGGVGYNATVNPLVGGAIGGAIGGLATSFALRRKNTQASSKQFAWLALAWPIGVAIGWTIGEALTEAIGIAIGYAIGIATSVAMIVFLGKIILNWKNVAWIVLA